MAKITNITTGEQSVSATGAVTGSLDTSALTGDYTVKLRVWGLTSAQSAMIAIEDTANASAFSDAKQVAVAHVVGVAAVEGVTFEWKTKDIPVTRFGATNTKLRANVLGISGSPTFNVFAWLEQ